MLIYLAVNLIVIMASIVESYSIRNLSNPFYISRTRKIFNYSVIIILSLVSGTRLTGGTDFFFYEQAYNVTPGLLDVISNNGYASSNFWLSGMDVGYIIIMAAFKSMGVNFHGFCLLCALFFHLSLYKGISRYCNNFSVVLLVYIAKLFLYNTFISMRQSITIAIFFLALSMIENRNIFIYMIISFLCCFIHAGAVIMIPVYFITYINLNSKVFKRILLVFVPFLVLNVINLNPISTAVPLFSGIFGLFSANWSEKVENYILNASYGMNPLYVVEYMAIAYLVLQNSDYIFDNDKMKFVLKLFLCLWPLFTLFGEISAITREKDYFIISYGLIVSYCMGVQENKSRWVILPCTIAICTYEFWRYLILFDYSNLLNYTSWIFN